MDKSKDDCWQETSDRNAELTRKNSETAALIATLIKKYLAIFLTGATGFENIFFVSFLPKTSVNAINPVIVKEKMLIMDGANSNPNKPSTTTIVPNIPFLSSIFFS